MQSYQMMLSMLINLLLTWGWGFTMLLLLSWISVVAGHFGSLASHLASL